MVTLLRGRVTRSRDLMQCYRSRVLTLIPFHIDKLKAIFFKKFRLSNLSTPDCQGPRPHLLVYNIFTCIFKGIITLTVRLRGKSNSNLISGSGID